MAIVNMLELSSVHLSSDTRSLLTDASPLILDHIAVYDAEYGWFIPVDTDSTEDLPEDLTACILYVHKLGCLWLHFDSDGDICEDLPRYGWH